MKSVFVAASAALCAYLVSAPVQAADVSLNVSSPAKAVEGPLDNSGLIALAKSGQAWCSKWRERDASCEDIGFLDLADDGKVRQTYRYRLSTQPDLQVLVRETLTIENGAICAVFSFHEAEKIVLLDGQRAPDEQAMDVLAIMQENMAEFEGRKACQSFAFNSEGELVSKVTIDGQADPSLDATYRLLAPNTPVHLRPVDEGDDPRMLQT